MDLWFCILTVASIGLLIYCLADVDQTHTGFMRISVERLDQLEFVGRTALAGDTIHSNNSFSGIWAAMSLLNGSNSSPLKKSSPRRTHLLKNASLLKVPSRGSSVPAFPETLRSTILEGKGHTSLQNCTYTRSRSDNGGQRACHPAAETSACLSPMESRADLMVDSAEDLDKMRPADGLCSLSSPMSSLAGVRPQVKWAAMGNAVPKSKSKPKRNSILVAKDAFASFSQRGQKENNVTVIDME